MIHALLVIWTRKEKAAVCSSVFTLLQFHVFDCFEFHRTGELYDSRTLMNLLTTTEWKTNSCLN